MTRRRTGRVEAEMTIARKTCVRVNPWVFADRDITVTISGRIARGDTWIVEDIEARLPPPPMVAALFVENGGCYCNLPGVDSWPIERDARLYRGPHPVVAHPPCERWGRFATGSPLKKEYAVGDDGGCFKAALADVTLYGGVLEHPAHSKAWVAFGLPKPPEKGWLSFLKDGWVCSVEQGHYGHVARKATWLVAFGNRPPELIWGPAEQRLPVKRLAERGYASARRCGAVANQSSQQRQRTPAAFRDVLLSIARQSRAMPIDLNPRRARPGDRAATGGGPARPGHRT